MALHKCNLLECYLNIVHDLHLLAILLCLTYTFIPYNMPSATKHSAGVDAHILDKLKAERMSGPHTIDEVHILFCGHF
jgi:hypothetical protein